MKTAAYEAESKVIWGTGDTEEAARADAVDWISRNSDEAIDDLVCEQCTDALAEAVTNRGGQVPWEWGGTADERYMTLS